MSAHDRDLRYDPLRLAAGPGPLPAALFLLLLLLLSGQALPYGEPSLTPEARIDSVFADYTTGRTPGAAVLVAKDHEIVFQRCYGFADIGHRVPVKPGTRFRIGSISKQFTAAAILTLEEQGLLTTLDPLSKYIPDYPRGDEITLDHLLTHTSGIPDYTHKDGFWIRSKIPIEADSLIAQFKWDSLEFAPGESWQYSNSNYFLLGEIIGRVSGTTYADYLAKTFFAPLGMKDTGVHDIFEVYDDAASGYEYAAGKMYNAELRHDSHFGGAGSLYATALDLYIWTEAIFTGEVLSEESRAKAMTPVKWGDGEDLTDGGFRYGCGWGLLTYRGVEVVCHGGGFNGWDSWLARYPAHDLTIVVLTNSNLYPERLASRKAAHRISEIYLADHMSGPEDD